jgi:hypothetical protein
MNTLSISPSEIRQVLERAAELLEPEGAWCQGNGAVNAHGHATPSVDDGATARCLAGALNRAAYEMPGSLDLYPRVIRLLTRRLGYEGVTAEIRLYRWNDDRKRIQAEVLALLRETAAEVAA